jgi:hypothetical protein
MEDPCLYATNPLFGADGEGAKFPIESPSIARARWVGLPEMPNCSVSNIIFNVIALLYLLTIMSLDVLAVSMVSFARRFVNNCHEVVLGSRPVTNPTYQFYPSAYRFFTFYAFVSDIRKWSW